jgi:CRP-like cAMP-binding protein
MGWDQHEVRSDVLQTLALNHYRTYADQIKPYLRVDAEEAARLLMLLAAIEDKPDHSLVVDTLNDQLVSARDRMLFLFSLVYEMLPILQARSMLHLGSDAERDYAIEVINIQVPHDMKAFIQPLLAPGLDTAARLQQIKSVVTISDTPLEILLINAIKDETQMPWLRAVLLQAAQQLDIHLDVDSNTLVWQETITMLSTIERVLILKTVHLFSSIPDHILAELAGILEEQRFSTGETIFKKGDFGSSMFVIVRGKVRAHDGHVIFNTLSDREVFGELAVLDTEPRTASISAVEETHVFRLDQAAFYQVMADYPQISQGVIRTLLGYLRARIQDISELNARIQEAS